MSLFGNNNACSLFGSSPTPKQFDKTINIDNDLYKLIIKLDEQKSRRSYSFIYITCNSIDENISLYDYSKELGFDDFGYLGYSFKQCKNLDEIFDLLKNIINHKIEVLLNDKELKSNYEMKMLNNGDLSLVLTIPLIIGKNETIEIKFYKKQKDPVSQFEKLKKKYKSLRQKIYDRNTNTLKEDEKNFIKSLIDEFGE